MLPWLKLLATGAFNRNAVAPFIRLVRRPIESHFSETHHSATLICCLDPSCFRYQAPPTLLRDRGTRTILWAQLGSIAKNLEFALSRFRVATRPPGLSVSQANLEQVTKYIARQEDHHRKVSFQDELGALLRQQRLNGMNERHVWNEATALRLKINLFAVPW